MGFINLINMHANVLHNILVRVHGLLRGKSHLEGNGERVDIIYRDNINYEKLDMYQQSHYCRYEYAVSVIASGGISGDFACGTGYGTAMLSRKSGRVVGADINRTVIRNNAVRYNRAENVKFIHADILHLEFSSYFDAIVSFETIEHFEEQDITRLFDFFQKAMKPGGLLIFSTPFKQQRTPEAIKMGFHRTFNIDESKIDQWLSDAKLKRVLFKYQNYQTHDIEDRLDDKDFIICVARK